MPQEIVQQLVTLNVEWDLERDHRMALVPVEEHTSRSRGGQGRRAPCVVSTSRCSTNLHAISASNDRRGKAIDATTRDRDRSWLRALAATGEDYELQRRSTCLI